MSETAAIVAAVILAALAVFQALLAAGAALGHFAWGGSHRILPTRLRIASAASIFLYAVIALVILDRAELVSVLPQSATRIACWALAGYFVIGALMNWRREKRT